MDFLLLGGPPDQQALQWVCISLISSFVVLSLRVSHAQLPYLLGENSSPLNVIIKSNSIRINERAHVR